LSAYYLLNSYLERLKATLNCFIIYLETLLLIKGVMVNNLFLRYIVFHRPLSAWQLTAVSKNAWYRG